jgi:hypothetical protein
MIKGEIDPLPPVSFTSSITSITVIEEVDRKQRE